MTMAKPYREPLPRHTTLTLDLELQEPLADDITCRVCNRSHVEWAIVWRFGGQVLWQGLHEACRAELQRARDERAERKDGNQ